MTTYRERFGCDGATCREHGDPDRTFLTFGEVAVANRVRCAKWHDPTTEPSASVKDSLTGWAAMRRWPSDVVPARLRVE